MEMLHPDIFLALLVLCMYTLVIAFLYWQIIKQLNLYIDRNMGTIQNGIEKMEALIKELDRRVNNLPPGYTSGPTNANAYALGDLSARTE